MPASARPACGKVRGRAYCEYGAAKKETFFGWRLHRVCTTSGVPVACVLLSTRYHDLTPLHALLYGLPPGAYVYADKADNRADDEASILTETGVHLAPIRTDNRAPNTWAESVGLCVCRTTIETVNSQFEAMGLQRFRARTNAGFEIKVQASVLALALACANAD